jgi:hypothetical protein
LHYRGDTPKLRIESSNTLDTTSGTEEIGRLEWEGFRNTNFNAAASIRARQDGTWSTITAWNSPAALEFYTQDNTGVQVTTPRVLIDSSGRVGIGTTSPLALFDAKPSSNRHVLIVSSASYADNGIVATNDAGSEIALGIGGTPIQFFTGATERARIDSSGRLLVGTSTGTTVSAAGSTLNPFLQLAGTSSNSSAQGIYHYSATSGGAAGFVLAKSSNATLNTQGLVSNGHRLGYFSFNGSDGAVFTEAARIEAFVDGTPGAGDMPGRLVFSTTADGASSPTERMRITNGGAMLQGNTSDLTGVLGTGLKVKSNAVGSDYSAAALCLQGTGGDFYAIKFADQDMGVLSVTSGATDYIQIGGSLTTATLYSNGLVQLPNVGTTASAANVFMNSGLGNQLARSTSSLRYKTDIEDLDTYRADAALSLRPVWYRSKATADRKDWSHYGLIAEEVAEIEPRLVNWTYLEDEYITVTNEYGIESKELKPNAKLVPDGVQYERLSVLLLSVIQRQEKRIEYLEAEIAEVKAQLA